MGIETSKQCDEVVLQGTQAVVRSPSEDAAKKERERDKRLRKKYHWSLARRNQLSDKQERKCALCGRPENPEHPLNLDHFHYKVTVVRLEIPFGSLRWEASTVLPAGLESDMPFHIHRCGKTKAEAIRRLHEIAKPMSVRGLLCPGRRGCNRKIAWVDNVEFLERTLAYVKNPPARTLDKTPEI